MLIRREDFKDIKKLTSGSHKKIWFTCESCGIGTLQEWRVYIKQKNGKFCRKCRNLNTANKFEVKNKQSEYSIKRWKNEEYRKIIKFKLSKSCKKSWNEERKKWLSKNNPMKKENIIKKVSEKEAISIKELKNICKENGYEFIDRILGKKGGTRIKFKCTNGHIVEKRLDIFRRNINGCPKCRILNSNSKGESELFDFIKSLNLKVKRNNRSLIYPLELDIVIPEKKIAIEYCGLYWHSEEQGKDKNYHLNKLNLCNKIGYKLITIFEDEWINKQDIVKRRLFQILNLNSRKVYARNCEIREINSKEAKEFINKYHIQGYQGSNIKLGAFYNNELLSVMTFSKPSIAKGRKDHSNEIFEISRFCTSTNVIGIASKFIKHFQRNYEWKEIYSFADRRWSNGNLYKKIGMKLVRNTKPNYFYWNNELKRYHRFYFRKSRLNELLEEFNPNLTEYQNMVNNGWNRIWDCGNKLYKIENKRSTRDI